MNKKFFLGLLIGLLIGFVGIGYLSFYQDRNETPIDELRFQLEQEQMIFQEHMEITDSLNKIKDSTIALLRFNVDSLQQRIVLVKKLNLKHHAQASTLSDPESVLLLRSNLQSVESEHN